MCLISDSFLSQNQSEEDIILLYTHNYFHPTGAQSQDFMDEQHSIPELHVQHRSGLWMAFMGKHIKDSNCPICTFFKFVFIFKTISMNYLQIIIKDNTGIKIRTLVREII